MQPAGCLADVIVKMLLQDNYVTDRLRLQFNSIDYLPGELTGMAKQFCRDIFRQNFLSYLSDNNLLAAASSNFHLDWGFDCFGRGVVIYCSGSVVVSVI